MPSKILKIVTQRPKRTRKRTTRIVLRKPKKQMRRKTKKSAKGSLLNQYVACLNDPFEQAPVRLGFGTFIPTTVVTGYGRTSINTNAIDGSFSIVGFPSVVGTVITNVAGNAATPTWVSSDCSNATNIIGSYGAGRVIAFGVRIFPMIAATSPPGMIALGLAPSAGSPGGVTLFGSNSTANLFNQPFMNIHKATSNCSGALQVLWRPEDVSDMEFDRNQAMSRAFSISGGTITGVNDTGPVICIAGQGLPLSTSLWYEFVVHIEATASLTPGAAASTTTDDAETTVRGQGQVTSLENTFSTVMSKLAPLSGAITDAVPYMSFAARAYSEYHRARGAAARGPLPELEFVHV